jgi:rhodanese-related sulfurtransferase
MFDFLKRLFGNNTDYKALMSRGAIIVDVRTPEEFTSGHIKGALNYPLQTLSGQVQRLKDKGKPIIVCCRSGSRSAMAKQLLKAQGIEVYNGGGWGSLSQKLK